MGICVSSMRRATHAAAARALVGIRHAPSVFSVAESLTLNAQPPSPMSEQLDTLLSEERRFAPSKEFADRPADRRALPARRGRSAGVLGAGSPEPRWSAPWSSVLEWTPPHAKWFVGGKLNVSVNCLDGTVGARRNRRPDLGGEPATADPDYWELSREVNRAAGALRRLAWPGGTGWRSTSR